jgi:HSP20 family protein
MASLYYLNEPPHPFWDFVANLEHHPFFTAHVRPPPYATQDHVNSRGQQQANSEQARPQGESSNEKQPQQGNPPPSGDQEAPRTRSLGENNKEKETGVDSQSGPAHCGGEDKQGRCGGGRGYNREFPFRGCPSGFGRGRGGPHHHRGAHRGGRGWGHHRHARFGPPQPFPGGHFDLQAFLQRLGSQLGIDLDEMWKGYQNQNENIDFVPRADVFDTPAEYIVHVSLPGAQKPDISVDYDAESSALRLAGVVYRPGMTEELNNALAVEERSREVGVFEREVKLGTPNQPANVDVEKISATLVDGILIVRVPKVQVDPEKLKRKVTVEDAEDEAEKLKNNNKPVNDNDYYDGVMHVDSETERAETEVGDATLTPRGSDSGDFEDDGKEYVKVDVQ